MTFDEFLQEWHDDNPFIKVRTSGSTGNPKEIKLYKDFVGKSARRTIKFFYLNDKSHLHSCVSADYIGGKMMAVRAALTGAQFSSEHPSNTPLTDLDPKITLDLVAVVPSQMLFILENRDRLPDVKNFIIGGSTIHPDLWNKIAESGINAYQTYGMTETASHIALRRITKNILPFSLLPEIKIEQKTDGCLRIIFEDGKVIDTNDIVELVSEREFFIKGRKDQMIISGGRKINPLELEEKISGLLSLPYCVTGFADIKWGEKIVLLIESEPFPTDILEEKLKSSLESWQKPKSIIFLRHLPHTSNGKILRPRSLEVLKSKNLLYNPL